MKCMTGIHHLNAPPTYMAQPIRPTYIHYLDNWQNIMRNRHTTMHNKHGFVLNRHGFKPTKTVLNTMRGESEREQVRMMEDMQMVSMVRINTRCPGVWNRHCSVCKKLIEKRSAEIVKSEKPKFVLLIFRALGNASSTLQNILNSEKAYQQIVM